MKFHIIMVMFNVEPWIDENIQLLKGQTFKDFQVVLVDDLSTDKTVTKVQQAIKGDSRFSLIVNREKKYKAHNVVSAIGASCAQDEDVVLLVDGDDRLAHGNVLQILYDVYKKQDCWMTYGSYTYTDGTRHKSCRPYRQKIIENNSYRKTHWLASHLKTFKFKLWKQLGNDVFKITDSDIKRAKLRALFTLQLRYAMLEISGSRACYIDNELYVHRVERTPYYGTDQNYGANKSEKWHTRLIRHVLVHHKPYRRLNDL